MQDRIILTENFLENHQFRFGWTSDEVKLYGAALQDTTQMKGWVYENEHFSIKIVFPSESKKGVVRINDPKQFLLFSFRNHLYLDNFISFCNAFDNKHLIEFANVILVSDIENFCENPENQIYLKILDNLKNGEIQH